MLQLDVETLGDMHNPQTKSEAWLAVLFVKMLLAQDAGQGVSTLVFETSLDSRLDGPNDTRDGVGKGMTSP